MATKNEERINELETNNIQLRLELADTRKTITSVENQLKSFTSMGSTRTQDQNLSPPVISQTSNNIEQETRYQNQIDVSLKREANKTLVLYGLNEFRNENEYDLYERVTEVFYQITNVNLAGYIEDIRRIGKRGWRRPLVIELLSKRTTKYILSNVKNFKNSGLWVSEYLDEQGLHERKIRRERYKKIKQNGNYSPYSNAPNMDNSRSSFNDNQIEIPSKPVSPPCQSSSTQQSIQSTSSFRK